MCRPSAAVIAASLNVLPTRSSSLRATGRTSVPRPPRCARQVPRHAIARECTWLHRFAEGSRQAWPGYRSAWRRTVGRWTDTVVVSTACRPAQHDAALLADVPPSANPLTAGKPLAIFKTVLWGSLVACQLLNRAPTDVDELLVRVIRGEYELRLPRSPPCQTAFAPPS